MTASMFWGLSRKAGAYLMYLDIGANAAKVYRAIMSEHFSVAEFTIEYPLVVAILGKTP